VEPHQKGLKNVNVKMTMFVFIIELGFLLMAMIVGGEAQSTPFPWNIEPNTMVMFHQYHGDVSSLHL
jgi:hypothetical protein